MNLPLYIAKRYLFARKSHNVINIISAISAIGMAVGTAALILILSIYNGFDGIIRDNLSDLDPDVLITAAEGKSFVPEGPQWDALLERGEVASICSVIEDNVFLRYGDRQGIARAKGVDKAFEEVTSISEHIIDGEFRLHDGEAPLVCMGADLAYNMGIRAHFLDPLDIYFPDRDSRISPSNPAASLHSTKVWPGSIFSISADSDGDLLLIPIECMRELTGYEREVTGVEVRLADGSDRSVRHFISSLDMGDGFKVEDRVRQHPSLYKMMRYEKLAIYLILVFVVIIVAFNIFGSLSMLIIEKKEDIGTLQALGATEGLTKKIFVLEGWLISLLGLAAGLVIGVALALVQQHFGIVKIPGNYLINAYPVILQAGDVILTAASVAAIGLVIALLSAGKAGISQKH